jgi:protein SCO1/2
MKSTALAFWIILAVVSATGYGSWVAWQKMHPPERRIAPTVHVNYKPAPPPGPPIKEFELVERSGKEFDSKELKGKVWIGSFFFANCPAACWQLNQTLKGVADEFKDTDLQLVSISCDPKNDNPEALKKYADRLQAHPQKWLFLTGDIDYIKRIGRDIFLQQVEEGGHRNSALVIDRNGKIRGSFDLLDATKTAEMKTLLKELLAEKASDAEPAATEEPAIEKSAEETAANKS